MSARIAVPVFANLGFLVAAVHAGGLSENALPNSAAVTDAAPSGPATVQPYSVLRTQLSVLMNDPAARSILEQHIPGIAMAARVPSVRYAPLKVLQSFAPEALTDTMLASLDAALSQLTPAPATPGDTSPWRPINVDESAVGSYTLPDPLTTSKGRPVRTPGQWWRVRRPEILELFATQQFGRAPGRPKEE